MYDFPKYVTEFEKNGKCSVIDTNSELRMETFDTYEAARSFQIQLKCAETCHFCGCSKNVKHRNFVGILCNTCHKAYLLGLEKT